MKAFYLMEKDTGRERETQPEYQSLHEYHLENTKLKLARSKWALTYSMSGSTVVTSMFLFHLRFNLLTYKQPQLFY